MRNKLHVYFDSLQDILPFAASATVILPATMSLTMSEMSLKSLNVTKGTFSRSQYVTKSVIVSEEVYR